ncbi:Short-chain dehydrogenase/reductase SDR [metagenome]|uniref:Short-chain dehydrogenase/reductase SDR n=1 Tax=metagenome TaxID=256318 RepID=A0A2P2CAD2_9ZZZZ
MGVLDGKVALVTGAARAQGRAHAVALASRGADLILCDVASDNPSIAYPMGTEAELEETVQLVVGLGRRVVSRSADVRSQVELDELVSAGVSELGRVDVLIANAGVFHMSPFWELSEDHWAAVVDTNLGGVWRSAKAVMPYMIEQGGGSMVLVSSVNGLEPADGWAHYAASKHGVIGLMRSIALEGARHGVRCNAVCPGFVKSGMTTAQSLLDVLAGHPDAGPEVLEQAGLAYHPTKGLSYLEPEQVAEVAAFLASPAAEAVTGVALPVDAGHLLVAGRVTRT